MNENKADVIITRFPPSPTGYFHIGNVRTALFNYLFARQHGGKFVLRIEDTDKERSRKEYEDIIIDSLKWLGLENDGTVFKQSERTSVYRSYLEKLIAEGKAYVSKEEPKEEGQRSEVIRFKNPNVVVGFNDMIRGEVKMDTSDLGDFVIAKSLDEPVYHLAVVVDDAETGVTHVIRGEDHISNTPRQMLIQEALGFQRPMYGHLPLILAEDRTKLSKRKHGERVSLKYYIGQGYLKEALINYMALLGWNPGGEQEVFTMEELVRLFDITKVQKGGAVFNEEKLRWVNREHVKLMDKEALSRRIAAAMTSSQRFVDKGWKLPSELLEKIVPVVSERMSVFSEVKDMVHKGELDYFFEEPDCAPESLVWKDGTKDDSRTNLEVVCDMLSGIGEGEWGAEKVKEVIWPYAEEKGRGSVLWPLRFALSGKERSPDPFILAGILGKETTIRRIEAAIGKLA